jgi:hypothetical protein
MPKHKQVPAITEAARQAGAALATWGAVETMARRVMAETEERAQRDDFAEFLLSGKGSKALVRIGGSIFRIED